MNEKLEQTITCLVCDNYDDVSVVVDGLKDCDKCTLSFFTEIQEFDTNDVLCFGCYGKLTISSSFLRICRESEKCVLRKSKGLTRTDNNHSTKEIFPKPEYLIEAEEYQEIFVNKCSNEEESNNVQNMYEMFVESDTDDLASNSYARLTESSQSCETHFKKQEFKAKSCTNPKSVKQDIYKDANYDELDKLNTTNERSTHEKVRLIEEIWTCSFESCDKTFKTRHGRWKHEYKHKNESKSCHICGKILKTTWAVNEHIKVCHTKSDQTFKCTQCHKEFRNKKTLLSHIMTHDESRRTQECKMCKMRFFTRSKLERHINQVHSDEKNFRCTYEGCSYKTATNYNLKRHRLVHENYSK